MPDDEHESNALPGFMYHDPANFIRFEREYCTGCKYERGAGPVMRCVIGDHEGKRRTWGIRCVEFVERGI